MILLWVAAIIGLWPSLLPGCPWVHRAGGECTDSVLCAVAAPSVNSYKRLVVGRALSGATWAPAYIAYGDNNRTACVRIPYGRLEIRLSAKREHPRAHRIAQADGRAEVASISPHRFPDVHT